MNYIIPKGTGFWRLDKYPWGGSFARAQEDMPVSLVRVIDTYSDGTPRKVQLYHSVLREVGTEMNLLKQV